MNLALQWDLSTCDAEDGLRKITKFKLKIRSYWEINYDTPETSRTKTT